jgi:hypothetical protein
MRGRVVATSRRGASAARWAVAAACAVSLHGPWTARAADTIEPWDAGAASFELYATKDGLESGVRGGVLGVDAMLGYGVADRLSAYFQAELAHPIGFGNLQAMPHFGVFGTALESDHFDLDLLLDFAVRREDVHALPGLELNLDSEPEQHGVGAYLRSGLPLSGHMILRRGRQHTSENGTPNLVELTFGAYLSLRDEIQLFLEHDGQAALRSGERRFESGGFAFGTNVLLSDSCELVTQAYAGSDAARLAVTAGVIVSLPPDS